MDAKQLRIPRSTIRSLICKGKLESQFIPAPHSAQYGVASGTLCASIATSSYPVILLLGWADMKGTAAVSSAFIVLNSASGLLGHIARGADIQSPIVVLVTAVVLGGFFGSRLGAQRLNTKHLQLALGLVLVVAGGKLILPWLV